MYAAVETPFFRPMPGLGASTAQLATSVGASVGSSAVAIGVATGAIAGPVGAIIGAGIGLVTTLVSALIANSGCGITCVETSNWANQAEPLLLQNIQAYFAQPAPRSLSSQQQALTNFDAIWATLTQQCQQPGTGDAGKRCISDRQAGACKWKQSASSLLLPFVKYGEPDVGQCWNWVSGYRTPIESDPDVGPDTQSALALGAADLSAAVLGGGSSSLLPIALIAAAVLITWKVVA